MPFKYLICLSNFYCFFLYILLFKESEFLAIFKVVFKILNSIFLLTAGPIPSVKPIKNAKDNKDRKA